jgi:hypothetical protein
MHYSDVRRNTKIVYDPTDELRFSNPYNIEYRPQGDTAAAVAEAQRFFSNLVTTELRLRGLPLYANVEERRKRLEKLLIVEQKIDLIHQAVLRGDEGKEAAMLLISQAIPWILHLENRVGEKLVTVLLAMAANKFQQRSNCRTLTHFANIVQDLFNTKILGSFTQPSQWKLPMSAKGDTVAKVSLSNKKNRLVVDNITHLISFTFSNPADEEKKKSVDETHPRLPRCNENSS